MSYNKEIEIKGDAERALDLARAFFINMGYQVKPNGTDSFQAVGGGLNSTRQHPIWGVSKAELIRHDQRLSIDADLGGIQLLKWFLYLFPPLLALLLFFVFLIIKQHLDYSLLIPFLAISPWIVISPLMVYGLKRRTYKALDTLLINLSENSDLEMGEIQ